MDMYDARLAAWTMLLEGGPDVDELADRVGITRDVAIILLSLVLYEPGERPNRQHPYALKIGILKAALAKLDTPDDPALKALQDHINEMIDRFERGKDAALFALMVVTRWTHDLNSFKAMALLRYLRQTNPRFEKFLASGNLLKHKVAA